MAGYVMGVDGGGTKTEYVLLDVETGERIGGGRLGAMNPFAADGVMAETAAELAGIVRRHELECERMRVGCAGAGVPAMAQAVKQTLISVGIKCPLTVVGDHENAISTAFGDGDGAVLISGTGSICCARSRGVILRAGGRGHVFDDGGSGYAIGRDILTAVAKASDGRSQQTALTSIVRDFSGMEGIADITSYYTDPMRPKADIASLAQMLGSAVTAGDEAARQILAHAADELCETASAVLSQMDDASCKLALTGSVLTGNRALRLRVSSLLFERFPRVESFVLYTRAAEGAAHYALGELNRR